ncbi:glycoside hydrolase family 127 protein [Pelomyxa schiedti]|nr:glycoside hydrolase family 127 protein [Pelomyxa schiedti]
MGVRLGGFFVWGAVLVMTCGCAAEWRQGHAGWARTGGTPEGKVTAWSAGECHDACAAEAACRAWTWYSGDGGACLLMGGVTVPVVDKFAVSGVSASDYSLEPRAYNPLPVGSVTPQGWLLKQLQLQEEGLAGHLALFWADIEESVWIGGTADGGLHERTPYWLNGVTPLEFQLRNAAKKAGVGDDALCQEGVDMMNYDITNFYTSSVQACHDACVDNMACVGFVVNDCDPENIMCWLKSYVGPTTAASCRCWGTVDRTYPPLWNQTQEYLTYILAHQEADGWIGPDDDPYDGNIYWGRFDVLQTFTQWAEADPSMFDQITVFLMNFLLDLQWRMTNYVGLQGWAAARWMDLELTIQWMLENAPQGQEQALWDLGEMAHSQGYDWETWFQTWTGYADTHGVNNAQALKSAAVWWRQSHDDTLPDQSISRVWNVDKTYGVSSGLFCADEVYCESPEEKHPSRGTELCAVVEAMFSYETMFAIQGDVMFADRAERVAFNALPATWASATGGDMWNHQYLQGTNQIFATHADPHIWSTDGPDSMIYGLEPNYGCCTANFPQGWPKYLQYSIFTTADGGVAIGQYAPAIGVLPDKSATVTIDTNYPFDSTIQVTLSTTIARSLNLRIPQWATDASILINGKSSTKPAAGTMYTISAPIGITTVTLDVNPSIRLESWYPGAVSLYRGPLMFAANLPGSYSILTTYAFESVDVEVMPTTEWRWALDINPNDLSQLSYFQPGYVDGNAPFNHTNFACYIEAPVRRVNTWGLYKNAAAAPPPSPACSNSSACSSASGTIKLVPYGCTDLRISQMPLAYYSVPDGLPPMEYWG